MCLYMHIKHFMFFMSDVLELSCKWCAIGQLLGKKSVARKLYQFAVYAQIQ